MRPNSAGRNLRDVWTFPTKASNTGIHFAVYPEALPQRCIKAATPEAGCCEKCGAPLKRIIEKTKIPHDGETDTAYPEGTASNRLALLRQAARARGGEYTNETKTIGWKPTCKCNAGAIQSIVLDPFSGSGTTLITARKLNRRAVGYDTSAEYCEITKGRIKQLALPEGVTL
jgi:G:T/U-mismatch repair DNA glycosylase